MFEIPDSSIRDHSLLQLSSVQIAVPELYTHGGPKLFADARPGGTDNAILPGYVINGNTINFHLSPRPAPVDHVQVVADDTVGRFPGSIPTVPGGLPIESHPAQPAVAEPGHPPPDDGLGMKVQPPEGNQRGWFSWMLGAHSEHLGSTYNHYRADGSMDWTGTRNEDGSTDYIYFRTDGKEDYRVHEVTIPGGFTQTTYYEAGVDGRVIRQVLKGPGLTETTDYDHDGNIEHRETVTTMDNGGTETTDYGPGLRIESRKVKNPDNSGYDDYFDRDGNPYRRLIYRPGGYMDVDWAKASDGTWHAIFW